VRWPEHRPLRLRVDRGQGVHQAVTQQAIGAPAWLAVPRSAANTWSTVAVGWAAAPTHHPGRQRQENDVPLEAV